jgi:hypothetical protein
LFFEAVSHFLKGEVTLVAETAFQQPGLVADLEPLIASRR